MSFLRNVILISMSAGVSALAGFQVESGRSGQNEVDVKEAWGILATAIAEGSPQDQDTALCVVGKINGSRAAATLTQAVESNSAWVRASAIHALDVKRILQNLRLLADLLSKDTDFWVKVRIVEALGSVKQQSVLSYLESVLHDSDPKLRGVAFATLEQAGRPAIPVLSKALGDPNTETRITAIYTLGRMDKEEVNSILRPGLRDGSPEVRAATAIVLGKLGDRAALPELARVVAQSSSQDRFEAAASLALLGDRSGLSIITGAIVTGDARQKFFAIKAAARLHRPDLDAEIAQSERDPTPYIRLAVLEALQGEQNESKKRLTLARALGDPDVFVRLAAATALAQLRDSQGVDMLERLLKHTDPQVRQRVSDELGRLAIPETVNVLREALSDEDPFVRINAINALVKLHDNPSVARIGNLLPDPEREVVQTAGEGIVQLAGSGALAVFRGNLESDHPYTKIVSAGEFLRLMTSTEGEAGR